MPVVIDKNRVAMIGFSNGAYKLWNFVANNPDICKVAVMMSDNHVASAALPNLAKVNTILAMCGAKENSYFGMENTVNYINQRGGNAIFYKIPGANHVGTRKAAFETSKLLEWILEKMN